MNIVLRVATYKDFEGVSGLYDQLDDVHIQALPHFFRPVEGHARSREWFAEILADEDAAIFVAEQQETIIGMVHCYVDMTPSISIVMPRRFVHIEDLVVSQNIRQQGIGKMLTEHVHRWAFEQGIREIELDVWEFPASALTFYEKLGYETTRRRMIKRLTDSSS